MALAPSSPRLPSPPPPAEIQIGPNSPSGGAMAHLETNPTEQSLLDASSNRRIHPGTRAADMAAGPPLIPLSELESAFQLQEHLAALHFHHTNFGTQPVTRETAMLLTQPPAGIDRTLWLYELCRFLISQCNSLIVGFLFDAPPCSATTCPEMRASEWQFLCAVHDQPKSCCAIDYCCHTLDWAANVVTDQKIFPSRFVVLSNAQSKNAVIKNLVNVFRRLHRVFAHAWFQHRSVFWSVEGQTGLYVFFKTVCDLFDLLPAENYKLPPEAEGIESHSEPEPEKVIQILKPPSATVPASQRDSVILDADSTMQPTSRAQTNTRRHIRSNPSTGSAVSTVIEADEEEGESMARRLREMRISAPEMVEEEPEVAEVPVIVEHSIIEDASPQQDDPEPAHERDEADMSDFSDADQTVIGADDDEDPPLDSQPNLDAAQASSADTSDPPDASLPEPNSAGKPESSAEISASDVAVEQPAADTSDALAQPTSEDADVDAKAS